MSKKRTGKLSVDGIMISTNFPRNPFNFTEPYSIYNASEQLPISSNVNNKTNHEIYLRSFAEAVRAGTTHVMCAYNSINGTHACANSESNNGALKGELNFQGALISDWGGEQLKHLKLGN